MLPSTKNKYVYSLSSVFEFAVERDWLEDNPCRRVKSLKVKNAWDLDGCPQRSWTDCMRSVRTVTTHISIWQSGSPSRQGADGGNCFLRSPTRRTKEGQTPQRPQKVFDKYVGGLKWENVDLDKGLLLLTHTKTGLNRKVAVTGDALELLRDLSKTPCIHGYVFHINGVPVAGQTPLRESFERACQRAGLRRFSLA